MMDAFAAMSVVVGLEQDYPGFGEWYVNKVVPDVCSGDGVLVLAEQHGSIVGMGVGRRGASPKLRCIRVVPSMAGRGIGIHLVDKVLDGIGCDKPLATVGERVIHDLSRIFVNRFDFSLDAVERGIYRPGVLEYVFNSAGDHKTKTPY
jgi:hypothetical protein